MNPTLQPQGDTALVLTVSTALADQQRLWRMQRVLQQRHPDWWQVLGVGNLTVRFDPLTTDAGLIEQGMQSAWTDSRDAEPVRGQRHDIPVHYGGKAGPDLAAVAEFSGLTPQQVIELHAAQDYAVYCIGFLPGFPYLGGLDERLIIPRRARPRQKVPAGSVGIGGMQTGIYPCASPGGWHLIGRTDTRLFDVTQMPPALLAPGDTLRFVPSTEAAA
ncbi:5-oxoprolinase subunit PxpB [Silvimonas sp. JCM 19000]